MLVLWLSLKLTVCLASICSARENQWPSVLVLWIWGLSNSMHGLICVQIMKITIWVCGELKCDGLWSFWNIKAYSNEIILWPFSPGIACILLHVTTVRGDVGLRTHVWVNICLRTSCECENNAWYIPLLWVGKPKDYLGFAVPHPPSYPSPPTPLWI